MKKIFKMLFCGIICFALIAPISVSAENKLNNPELLRVEDNADLISESEEENLSEKISDITKRYEMDVVIITTNTIDGKTPEEYADDYYDYTGYGSGEENDGILLLVSMEDNDWHISTTGYAIEVFTDYGIKTIGEEFVSYLSDEEYYKGFNKFLDLTDEFMAEAENGTPFNENHKYKTIVNYVIAVGIGLGVGLIAAVIVTLIFKSKMKSVAMQQDANNYTVINSFNVTKSNDVFLYKTVNKVKKPEPSSSGGSSTHSGSSGTSHGGGGGKF